MQLKQQKTLPNINSMNIETSRISTIFGEEQVPRNKTMKSPLSPGNEPRFMKKSPPRSDPNDLNNWDVCNPENFEDQLPQPFRLINKLVYKELMRNVNQEIDRIEKAKLSHNYEGGVREVTNSGFFDIRGLSCMSHPTPNHHNYLFVGDRFGNLTVMDLNKRSVITRAEIMQNTRIQHINAVCHPFEDTTLFTISIVLHATKDVLVYRMKSNDCKLLHQFTIKCARGIPADFGEGTDSSTFAYETKISPDSRYLAITLFDGNVEVYRIPDPPGIPFEFPSQKKEDVNTSTLSGGGGGANTSGNKSNVPSINLDQYQNTANSTKTFHFGAKTTPLPTEPKDLDLFMTIELRAPQIEKDPQEQLFALLLNEYPKSKEESRNVTPEPTTNAPPKKGGGKAPPPKGGADKKGSEKDQESAKLKEFLAKEYQKNPVQLYPQIEKTEDRGDLSPALEGPVYKPYVFFQQQSVVMQDTSRKALAIEKVAHITHQIICAWKENSFVDYYHLETPTEKSIPLFQLNIFYRKLLDQTKSNTASRNNLDSVEELNSQRYENENFLSPVRSPDTFTRKQQPDKAQESPAKVVPPTGKADKSKDQNQQAQAPIKGLIDFSFETIYPISVAQISKGGVFLGLGLVDGSVYIYDIQMKMEKMILDRHQGRVTAIEFFEDWRVASGGTDGTVNLFDMQEPSRSIKYTQLYQVKDNSIISLKVNDAGIVFALDADGNLRTYDLFHFTKIFRVNPGVIGNRKMKFSIPDPIVELGREQFCILAEKDEPPGTGESEAYTQLTQESDVSAQKNLKHHHILIFRVYENLLLIFPGLSNIIKRGFERSKAFYAFANMSLEDLKNPDYEIPQIDGALILGDGTKLGKGSVASLASLSQFNQRSTVSRGGVSKSSTSYLLDQTFRDSPVKPLKKPSQYKAARSQNTNSTKSSNKGLTQDKLHPEKHLMQKPEFPSHKIVDPTVNTMENLRQRNQQKNARQDNLNNYTNKIKEQLDKEAEFDQIQKRKHMMDNSKLFKSVKKGPLAASELSISTTSRYK